MTRQEDLRSQISRQNNQLDRMKTVLRVMRYGSDDEATEVLARLRLGESIEELSDVLRRRHGRAADGIVFVPARQYCILDDTDIE
jgi:hypothetical protein